MHNKQTKTDRMYSLMNDTESKPLINTSDRNFDWNLVKSFLAILETGTLSAAAQKLNISQPTLSRQVDTLEGTLGVVLFERGRRGAIPTSPALAIAEHAREMFSATQALALSATGKSRQLRGTVRITASQVVATYILPPILNKLMEQAAEVEIELVATDKVENLTEREADIAVRMVRPGNANLIARKVNDIELGIYGHQDYLKNHPPIRKPSDFDAHRIIGYDRDERIINGMADAGLNVDRDYFQFRCDDQIVGWQALCAAMGVGFAPNYLARTRKELIKIAEDFPIPPLPVWLVTHREIKTSRRIRTVFDFLAEELAALDLE